MNERVEKLIERCTKSAMWPGDPDAGDFNKEKFAELLGKEFYETIKKDMELAQIQLIPLGFDMYANGRLRRIINEHFGVKV
jgi:hypothetical protein